jgi:hypothetical protein
MADKRAVRITCGERNGIIFIEVGSRPPGRWVHPL